MSDTIYVKEGTGVHVYKVCVIPDWQIEQIADAVVRKLGGMVSGCGYWDSESRICSLYRPAAEPRSASCDECEVAKYHNLEDDDSPCLNCGVGE